MNPFQGSHDPLIKGPCSPKKEFGGIYSPGDTYPPGNGQDLLELTIVGVFSAQLLRRNVKQFREGLVLKARRLEKMLRTGTAPESYITEYT